MVQLDYINMLYENYFFVSKGDMEDRYMGLDGKKEISLASLLLIVCGIVTMILAFVANSGTNKTNDTMKNLKTYAQAQQSQGQ